MYIKDEEARKLPLYTWQDYQYDKKNHPGKKETFAMAYWKVIEENLVNRTLEVRTEAGEFFSNNLLGYMNNYFFSARVSVEKSMQIYLYEHGFEVDQWPDPCLPVLFRTQNPYNFDTRVPEFESLYGKGRMFRDEDATGFVYNYFGQGYVHGQTRVATIPTISMNDDDIFYCPDVLSRKAGVDEKDIRSVDSSAVYHTNLPVYVKCQQEYKQAKKKVDDLIADADKKGAYKAAQENLKKAGSTGGGVSAALEYTSPLARIIWILLFLAGLLVASIPIYSVYLHFTGLSFWDSFVDCENFSNKAVQMLVAIYASIAGILHALIGMAKGTAYWVVIGILFVLLFIYMFVIFNLDGCPVGKKHRESKKIKKQYKKDVREAEQKAGKAAKDHEKEVAAVRTTDAYLQAERELEAAKARLKEAQKQEDWMGKHHVGIAISWHSQWYEYLTKLYEVPKMPTAEERKKFRVIYVKPVDYDYDE